MSNRTACQRVGRRGQPASTITDTATRPEWLRVREWKQKYRRGHSTLYALLKSGRLKAVKDGKSTLICEKSSAAWKASLPAFESKSADAKGLVGEGCE